MVDKAGLAGCRRKPVEFLVDRFLGLVEEKEIQVFQVTVSGFVLWQNMNELTFKICMRFDEVSQVRSDC